MVIQSVPSREWRAMRWRCVLTAVAAAFASMGSAAISAQAASANTRVLHKRIGVSLQGLMDDIHNYLPTDDYKHYTGSIGPTSAWLEPSAGGFTTNCNNPYLHPASKYGYLYYNLYTVGVGFKTCTGWFPSWAAKPPYTEKARPNEFVNDLNRLSNSLLRRVGLKTSDPVEEMRLDRSRGTIRYKVSPSSSAVTGSRIEKVTLTQAHGYVDAAITVVKRSY